MKVFNATIIDKQANPDWEEPVKFDSYVAVGTNWEMAMESVRSKYLPAPYVDEDIHYYFTEDEFGKREDNTLENDEFEWTIWGEA